MKIPETRLVSLEILKNKESITDLLQLDQYIKTDEDIIDICSFLDKYVIKHNCSKYISTDIEFSKIIIKSEIIADLLNKSISLEPQEFEKLSSIICNILGYSEFYAITKQSHDQGLDFIAYRKSNNFNYEYYEYIIGQSKHYDKTLVKTNEIREIAGSIFLFKNSNFSSHSYERFKEKMKSFTPVSVLFVSSFFFSENSLNLCRNSDIIPIDIIDVILILLNGIYSEKLDWLDINGKFSNYKFHSEIDKIVIEK